MKITHLAIWTKDLERMKAFYQDHFDALAGPKYFNPVKSFSSYFLTFPGNEVRLELMHRPDVSIQSSPSSPGLAHFAISAGSRKRVDALTEKLHRSGVKIVSPPRTTGDGYYESVFLDPEGNQVELTV